MIKRAGLCLAFLPNCFAQIASSPFALGGWQCHATSAQELGTYLAWGPADLYRWAAEAKAGVYHLGAWQEGNRDQNRRQAFAGTQIALSPALSVIVQLGLSQVQNVQITPIAALGLEWESKYRLLYSLDAGSTWGYPLSSFSALPAGTRSHHGTLISRYQQELKTAPGASIQAQISLHAERAAWGLAWEQHWQNLPLESLLAWESGPYPLRLLLRHPTRTGCWEAALRLHSHLPPSLALGYRQSLKPY